jgi:hypothetical protein
MEEHETTVGHSVTAKAANWGWIIRATCRCGWTGPARETLREGHEDTSAHLEAVEVALTKGEARCPETL